MKVLKSQNMAFLKLYPKHSMPLNTPKLLEKMKGFKGFKLPKYGL